MRSRSGLHRCDTWCLPSPGLASVSVLMHTTVSSDTSSPQQQTSLPLLNSDPDDTNFSGVAQNLI